MELTAETVNEWIQGVVQSVTSLDFYIQLGIVAGALVLAVVVAAILRGRFALLRRAPEAGPLLIAKMALHKAAPLLLPVLCVLCLAVASQLGLTLTEQNWIIRIALGLSTIFLAYSLIGRFLKNALFRDLITWVGVPIALLYVFGWLDEVCIYLEATAIHLGNIRISALAFCRAIIFGALLFWLGRVSSATGKRVIRAQPALDVRTREVVAKLFEIILFAVFALLLLQVVGINLTALAVFGGALGVGLGFGLQQIAANFISGIIILMDRSISIDDFIELEDGRSGRIRELNMRSATLETYDGKDIVVPNEMFMTTAFTNWTHFDNKQRYPLEFSVAYSTDLPQLFDIVRKVVASHPKVLSGEGVPLAEQPDAEISSFGDSGINILVEFWMEGIDDGENRVGADLLLMIWMALKQHNIEIPFPQREIKILNPSA